MKTIVKTTGFDILFLVAASLLLFVFGMVYQFAPILFVVVYYLVLVFLYSFVKKKIIKSITRKDKRTLASFTWFNLVYIGVYVLVILGAYVLIKEVVQFQYQKYFVTVFVLLGLIFWYPLFHRLQYQFLLKKPLKESVALVREKIWVYLLWILGECVVFGAVYWAYYQLYYFAGASSLLNVSLQVAGLVALIVFNAVNRVLFYHGSVRKHL